MQQIIFLLGGIAFLFLGMDRLSDSLSGLFTPRVGEVTASGGFLTGLLWTVAVQSSSTVAACLISLAQAGIFSALDCLPMLLGSNVGTTITVWLLSGVQAVSIDGIGLPLAFLALLLKRKPAVSGALFGLGLALSGMELLQLSAAPLRNAALNLRDPASAFLGTMAFTAVIQSSAVSIGALQQMELSMRVAFPAILGANVGTCATGLLTAAMLGRAGKQIALLELGVNLFSVLLLMPMLPFVPDTAATPTGIAAMHSLINAVTAAVLLPAAYLLRRKTLGTSGNLFSKL